MERIERAMQRIRRADFLPADQRDSADIYRPLSIGHGQTNSQPSTVRQMLQWLDPQLGDRVLDVGAGSGWTTALLATLVGDKGLVHAIELIPELVTMGRKNCAKYKFANVTFHEAGKILGLPAEAPFDRILVSAAADHLPQELIDQLAVGGRMVIPIHHDILVIDKLSETNYKITPYHGFIFVPLL